MVSTHRNWQSSSQFHSSISIVLLTFPITLVVPNPLIPSSYTHHYTQYFLSGTFFLWSSLSVHVFPSEVEWQRFKRNINDINLTSLKMRFCENSEYCPFLQAWIKSGIRICTITEHYCIHQLLASDWVHPKQSSKQCPNRFLSLWHTSSSTMTMWLTSLSHHASWIPTESNIVWKIQLGKLSNTIPQTLLVKKKLIINNNQTYQINN